MIYFKLKSSGFHYLYLKQRNEATSKNKQRLQLKPCHRNENINSACRISAPSLNYLSNSFICFFYVARNSYCL